jgi:transposase
MKRTQQDIQNGKLDAITATTLVVGVDVAKKTHFARSVDFRKREVGSVAKFGNDREGFELILSEIRKRSNENGFDNVVVGLEPTGHYWKALAGFLTDSGLVVVLVSPAHTKKAKELDDNSQTKTDPKDAITIARLVTDGRYSAAYLPEGPYADLRGVSAEWESLTRMRTSVANELHAMLDEFFPEFESVFKKAFAGEASKALLRVCPTPSMVLGMGAERIRCHLSKTMKRAPVKKIARLLEAAERSIGCTRGAGAAAERITGLMGRLDLADAQLAACRERMGAALEQTGVSAILLGMDGLGVVGAAGILAETGDLRRFESPRQLHRLAGYNLVESSSGSHKGRTRISKRGRSGLRKKLYQLSVGMLRNNQQMRRLYDHMRTRGENPLKGKQALVVVGKKILDVMFALVRKNEAYDPRKALGEAREATMGQAA